MLIGDRGRTPVVFLRIARAFSSILPGFVRKGGSDVGYVLLGSQVIRPEC